MTQLWGEIVELKELVEKSSIGAKEKLKMFGLITTLSYEITEARTNERFYKTQRNIRNIFGRHGHEANTKGRRMRKSDQTDKIVEALISIQKELEAVPKKGKNPHFGNRYVELEDALASAIPTLNKYNIFLTQTVDQNCLLTTLLHTSGQWIESAIPIINKKGDDQGQGGSITYAKRYGLLSILGIPTEDDDGNTASQDTIAYNKKAPHLDIPLIGGVAPKTKGILTKEEFESVNKPQAWGGYILKHDKYNKGKSLAELQVFWIKKQVDYWKDKEIKSKALGEDIEAMKCRLLELDLEPKVWRGNPSPNEIASDEHEALRFNSDEEIPF